MFDEKTESSVSDAPTTHRFRYPGELGFPPVPVSFEAPLGW
ncbi:MAG: hypothetical protein Q7T55_16255 [Solirubrobacteraceae bacterium]|nr:hypothetical protein [Solirubrobacteraceae bacterium]